jgi:hypothetical protein
MCFVEILITYLRTAFMSEMAFYCTIVKKKEPRLTLSLTSAGISK